MTITGSPLPPAPQPPHKSHTGLIILAVIGAVVLLCMTAGIVAAVTGGTTAQQHQVATTPDPGVTPSAAEPLTVDPTTEAPQPTTLLTTTGNGIKATTEFTTGDSWNLTYTFDCSGFGSSGNFAVTEYTTGEMTGILVNALAASGQDTVPVYDAGRHHLEVNSECDWTLTVVG